MPDELIDLRYRASIDPEVVADPPLRRLSGPTALRTCGGWTSPATAASSTADTDAGAVGTRRQGQPTGRRADAANTMPNAELVMTSHTGHWMQWERAELFNELVTEFLSPDSRLAA